MYNIEIPWYVKVHGMPFKKKLKALFLVNQGKDTL